MEIDKIPGVLGSLVINEDGSVQTSGGQLQNEESTSNILMNLIKIVQSVDPEIFLGKRINRIVIAYEQFNYTICLSNNQYYITKSKAMNDKDVNMD